MGYTAGAYIGSYGGYFDRICCTVRSAEKAKVLAETGISGSHVAASVFDGAPLNTLVDAMGEGSYILVSAPPASTAEVVLRALKAACSKAPQAVVYLSSLSVYGDYGGAEIDETAGLKPTSVRGRERIAAEEAWRQFGRETACPVAILRLAGIYGPGRNALLTISGGGARRIVKPNQVFNRIHVADIAQAIHAAFERKSNDNFNVSDDEPAPPQDVIGYAAQLLGKPLPPQVLFEDARPTMSQMAQSFYDENKRALNHKMKAELGVTLRYPNYRVGLDSLFAARDYE
jgi:nucleoside-diphosphate-sugar epimerase